MVVVVAYLLNLFHYRGMGNSTLSGDEELTIELMARDLLFLLKKLGWKEVALCGYSMGGSKRASMSFDY